VYALLVVAVYGVALAAYFLRQPQAVGARRMAMAVLPALLEAATFAGLCDWLLAAGPLRASRWRVSLYVIAVFLFTFASLVQAYALLISNSLLSVLAMENTSEAFLTASHARNVMLIAGALACAAFVFVSWRRLGRRLSPLRRRGVLAVAVVCAVGVAAFNAGTSVAGGEARLAAGQSPFASLLRVGLATVRVGDRATVVAPVGTGQPLCGTTLRAGRFPFLKDDLDGQPLPFPARRGVTRPNVIVLFIEGESARLFEAYGGHYPGLTPNVSRMARESMVVDDYFNHTAATFRGLQGQLTSGYPEHGGADGGTGWMEGAAATYAKRSYATLPKMLRQRGYETVFFSPHSSSDAMTQLARMLGFERIYMAQRSRRELLRNPENIFGEALTDRDTYRALSGYLEQRKGNTPFFISLYSLNTHAFLDIPPSGTPYRDGSEPSLNTLHTADAAFGEFYARFMASKYADNTLLILTSDHAHYPEPPYVRVAGSPYKPYFVDRIPLLIQAPWLRLPGHFDAHGRTSLDLAPTILQMLGIRQAPNSFLGHSLFDRRHDRPFSIAAIGQAIYAIYHGEVYAPETIPAPIEAGYARCKALVETYYSRESADAIFPAPGEGEGLARVAPGANNLAASLAGARPTGACALDTLDGRVLAADKPISLKAGQPVVATGWVVDGGRRAPPAFTLVLRGRQDYGFEASTGMPRPDVARALGAGSADHAGFDAVLDPARVHPGTYDVATLLQTDGGYETCDTHRRLIVAP
jgi:phosphoglycerol transferase MdoB-like AlkP superfamily enzyme